MDFKKTGLSLYGIMLFAVIAILLVNYTKQHNYATDVPFVVMKYV